MLLFCHPHPDHYRRSSRAPHPLWDCLPAGQLLHRRLCFFQLNRTGEHLKIELKSYCTFWILQMLFWHSSSVCLTEIFERRWGMSSERPLRVRHTSVPLWICVWHIWTPTPFPNTCNTECAPGTTIHGTLRACWVRILKHLGKHKRCIVWCSEK